MSPNRELALKECTVRILGKLYAEAKKQTNARFTETGWRQLHVLTGIFRKLNIQNHITTDLLRITQNMVKQGNYICQQQKDVTLINIIHSLSDTSKKYKILKNFFTWKHKVRKIIGDMPFGFIRYGISIITFMLILTGNTTPFYNSVFMLFLYISTSTLKINTLRGVEKILSLISLH